MIFRTKFFTASTIFIAVSLFSCKKDSGNKDKPDSNFPPKHIVYLVKGTNFRLNYIDSNSVFQHDQLFKDSFRYEFDKGPGASIGISIYLPSQTDTIFSWYIYINNKLYADAFSEGGAYLTVPYD